jgi:phosphoribosylaminoimidazolecarboxamide formyltransferase/IMP cyclohydrolase
MPVALVSVWNKEGLEPLMRSLVAHGYELWSTGGTEAAIQGMGLPVRSVSSVTGAPEILDGRVKTLHPTIEGGILARRDLEAHRAQLAEQGIEPIDLVVCNLYPFAEVTAGDPDDVERALEHIDIGGPTMVRAAAKNHPHVGVVVTPADYPRVIEALDAGEGSLSGALREELAGRAFAHTAAYDAAVADWFVRGERFPERKTLRLRRTRELRYGENSHQRAAFYAEEGWSGPDLGAARVLQGKALSFNNLLDADAAVAAAADLSEPGAVVIKHACPCGVGRGETLLEAYERALDCDARSAFGGVWAFNREVDEAVAEQLTQAFFEVVVAPKVSAGAREILARKKRMRVLELEGLRAEPGGWGDLRRARGGLLVSDWDGTAAEAGEVVTARAPSAEEWRALRFAWMVVRHVKSNAIVVAGPDQTFGIGAGQVSRVEAAEIAIRKAGDRARGAALAGDAFFPFPDGLRVALDAGVTAAIHPGGSIRDKEVIAVADEAGIAMVHTGVRHFRH